MNPRLLPSARLARSVLRTQSDERLTELARHGSDAAFETLVTRYRRSMVRHCDGVVGHTDAEEAVQNALLNAHNALSRGDSVRNVGPWLHAIAHNAALNILRARASRPEGATADCEQVEHHDLSAERRQDLREVIDALQSLPLRQRDAIVMRELEGLSYEEIAARMGSSSGAVRQLLNRARNAIRERLTVLPGTEPLIRWFAGGSGPGPMAARLGALAGGCAVTAKLCVAALVPATIMIATPPATPSARTQTRARSTTHFVVAASTPRPRPAVLTSTPTRARPHTAATHTAPAHTPRTTSARTTSTQGRRTTQHQPKTACPPTTTAHKYGSVSQPPQPPQTMGTRVVPGGGAAHTPETPSAPPTGPTRRFGAH
jgi:RNA polymerase sigma factor (sigma-70 family)